jgi:hypothetical protein
MQQLGRFAPRGREVVSGFAVVESEAKQSILSFLRGKMDSFASLAMTALAHSGDPLARNDGSTPECRGSWLFEKLHP